MKFKDMLAIRDAKRAGVDLRPNNSGPNTSPKKLVPVDSLPPDHPARAQAKGGKKSTRARTHVWVDG